MPIPTRIIPPVVAYSDPNYPEKKYQELKSLFDTGQREQVVDALQTLYSKDPCLANTIANRLGIDMQQVLDIIYRHQDSNYSTIVQIKQDGTTEIIAQYDNFHDTLETIQNYSQYKGNLADTLMVGISGIFGAMDKGLEELTENTQNKKLKIAKFIFQAEGVSISAVYGYGSNDRDMVKTAVSVGIELAGSYIIGLALEGVIVSLGLASMPAFIVVGAISALIAGILMNTQTGKWVINETTKVIRQIINSLESKLQSFFSLFDSNPSKYELVSNSTLEPNDYKSLIELLLDSNSNAIDIVTLLHTLPHYLTHTHTAYSITQSINSLGLSNNPVSIPMCIHALCLNHKNEPLTNKEIYVYSPNFTSFVDKAKSDDGGYIAFNNARVSSKMTNSDLYFVLNKYGLDEEQKDYHTKISPSKTIQPNDKKTRELANQTLVFNKYIPKAIQNNDSIQPNIKVNAIEFMQQDTNNSANIHLKAHYVLRDSQRKCIKGDKQTYLRDSIQKHRHKTKWGYIVFDKEENIQSTLQELTISKPLIKSKKFQELEGIAGEMVSIPFKEQWQDKQVRFFAYLYKPHKDVGWNWTSGTIITNSVGKHLFTIEKNDIKEIALDVKTLYNNYGVQWFESSAENYHKLLWVNPDLQDKEKCKKLGVLYFTWRDIVEFAEIDRMSISYQSGGGGDWKKSSKGARGYLLVSMQGIPYWADAVGQIPYAIGVYRNALREISASTEGAKQKVIDNKYDFYDGSISKGLLRKMGILSIPKDELVDNYDNKMVDRGLKFAQKKYIRNKKSYPTHYEWEIVDLKPNPILLALDSDDKVVYE